MQPITVVICTFNDANGLPSLLDELHSQTLQPTEIVVVDCGSVDGSAEVAISRGVAVLHLSQHDISTSYAVNLGLLHAPTELVVCLSGNAVLPYEEWLAEIEDRFAADPISLLFPGSPSSADQCYAAIRKPLPLDHRWREDESSFDWSMRLIENDCDVAIHPQMNLGGRLQTA